MVKYVFIVVVKFLIIVLFSLVLSLSSFFSSSHPYVLRFYCVVFVVDDDSVDTFYIVSPRALDLTLIRLNGVAFFSLNFRLFVCLFKKKKFLVFIRNSVCVCVCVCACVRACVRVRVYV